MQSQRQSDLNSGSGADAMRLALLLAREEAMPLEVGRLSWAPDGTLSLRAGDAAVTFTFLFRGLPFGVRIEGGDSALVTLTGELGKLPYTAEHPQDRRLLKRIALATERLPRGMLRVSESQDLQLIARTTVPDRPTPARVIATVTVLLLDLLPFLDLAETALSRRATQPA